MDLKRHEDSFLSLMTIIIAGIIVFKLQDFYVEYSIYFGWITIYVVHLVIVWVVMVLTWEKIKSFKLYGRNERNR